MARHTWPVSKIDLRREPWCIVIFMAESILPIIIRGSETAKVDCQERVGASLVIVQVVDLFQSTYDY